MVIAEVSVVPIGTGDASLSKYVADCHEILQDQDKVEYELTSMGTVMQGELRDILNLIEKLHDVPFAAGAPRVSTQVKIDERRDKDGDMKQKLKSVQDKLQA